MSLNPNFLVCDFCKKEHLDEDFRLYIRTGNYNFNGVETENEVIIKDICHKCLANKALALSKSKDLEKHKILRGLLNV